MSNITVLANKQEIVINAAPGITVLVPQTGVGVEVPNYTEINGFSTLEYINDEGRLPLRKWKHISTGGLFQELWHTVFDDRVPIPDSLLDLREASHDIKHIAGMIIMIFEAIAERGEKVFLREPETHLHPAEQRCLVEMLNKLIAYCDSIRGGGTITATEDPPPE
jgi:hypothetical protein